MNYAEICIIKRDGKREDFSISKIKNAISKAFSATGIQDEQQLIADVTMSVISQFSNPTITVEEIQDLVEKALMKVRPEVAKKYNKLFRLADKKDKKASFLPVESLREIYEALQTLPAEQRIKQYKLKPDRADVIVPAAEIFLEVATYVKATGIIVPTIGLSDGIIDSLYTQNMASFDTSSTHI